MHGKPWNLQHSKPFRYSFSLLWKNGTRGVGWTTRTLIVCQIVHSFVQSFIHYLQKQVIPIKPEYTAIRIINERKVSENSNLFPFCARFWFVMITLSQTCFLSFTLIINVRRKLHAHLMFGLRGTNDENAVNVACTRDYFLVDPTCQE
jgi:hypothetical protein